MKHAWMNLRKVNIMINPDLIEARKGIAKKRKIKDLFMLGIVSQRKLIIPPLVLVSGVKQKLGREPLLNR